MSKCTYTEPINPKLKFGVDLKEIYPPWYLHPALKNLIYLAEINVRNKDSTRFDIQTILGKSNNGEDSVRERLKLKQCIITGNNVLELNMPPGAPIWLIRHFIGLLPEPIFAPKSDPEYWFNISFRYYEPFMKSITKRSAPNHLTESIAFELAHLPCRNVTFLIELFELIRFLSMKSFSDYMIDRHSANLLVRYYTPALFVRPYRPGIFTKDDKKYSTFILFTVYFWPELRIKIHDIYKSSFNKNLNKFHYFFDDYNNKKGLNNYLKDKECQTECVSNSELFLNYKFSSDSSSESTKIDDNYIDKQEMEIIQLKQNNIITSTPNRNNTKGTKLECYPELLTKCTESIKENNCKFLHNISVQTLQQQTLKPSKITFKPKRKKRMQKKVSKSQDIIILEIPKNRSKKIKVISYKRYAIKNMKINKNGVVLKNTKGIKTQKSSVNCSAVTYDWNIKSSFGQGEFIPDSYVGTLYNVTKSVNTTKTVFSTPQQTSLPTCSDIYGKIAKYGWTYTKNNKSTETVSTAMNPYKLCHDIDQRSLNSLHSDTPLTESVKMKKSFLSFKSVSSKFKFLKKFATGKDNTKKSQSCADINSTIKYEKMSHSAKSL